ncbi:MAG: transcription elongation factor GreA [Candidatus Pacebacteria bacterium]|nr:transcription elongation factor GreA [Candidatus Paceibacterota bacterium]MDD4074193.1 transcription elongation factor GreA [Candidatus Paceibacterota bacterium]
MEEKYLTQEGLDNLKKELEYMKKEGRIEVSEQLKEAISFGDLSENAAYDEAKERQSMLESKILETERLINSAKVIEKNGNKGWVTVGSYVTIKNESGEERYHIVGEEEANPIENRISFKSPLGKELMDKPKGAEIKIETPKGVIKYKILKIE